MNIIRLCGLIYSASILLQVSLCSAEMPVEPKCWNLNETEYYIEQFKKASKSKDIDTYRKFGELLTQPVSDESDCQKNLLRLLYSNYLECPKTPRPANPEIQDRVIADQLLLKILINLKETSPPPEESSNVMFFLTPAPTGKSKGWQTERKEKTELWFWLLKRLGDPQGEDAKLPEKKLQQLREISLVGAREFVHYAYLAKPDPNPEKFRKLVKTSGLSKRLQDNLISALDVPLGKIRQR